MTPSSFFFRWTGNWRPFRRFFLRFSFIGDRYYRVQPNNNNNIVIGLSYFSVWCRSTRDSWLPPFNRKSTRRVWSNRCRCPMPSRVLWARHTSLPSTSTFRRRTVRARYVVQSIGGQMCPGVRWGVSRWWSSSNAARWQLVVYALWHDRIVDSITDYCLGFWGDT